MDTGVEAISTVAGPVTWDDDDATDLDDQPLSTVDDSAVSRGWGSAAQDSRTFTFDRNRGIFLATLNEQGGW